jgi:CelD/BcsL family acetyltransferase involved in cellulose biosynthesis
VVSPGVSEIAWEVTDEPGPETVAAWDRLAIALGRPYCAPAWMLGWAEGEGGPGDLRVGVASSDSRVVGILPLIGRPGPSGASYELLGSGIGYRVEPLAEPADRAAVAAAAGSFLAGLDPPPGELRLHGIDPEPGWGEAIAASWPGEATARVEREKTLAAPFLEFEGPASYDGWLGSKSRHFRKRAWSDRRRFERHGELRIAATAAELDRAIRDFAELHLGRWGKESRLAFEAMPERLAKAAEGLGPDRMRAATARVGDEVVAVDLFVRAGGVTAAWNGGWSEGHRALRPGSVTLLAGLEDAIESGVATVDLGPGAHPWKERLATREATVVTDRMVLPR